MRAIVVWLPMYPGDERAAWHPGLIDDARAAHLWDEHLVVGRWFAARRPPEGFRGGVAWDCFYVFGPAARWEDVPAPLVASGFPVVRHCGLLVSAVERVIAAAGDQRTMRTKHMRYPARS